MNELRKYINLVEWAETGPKRDWSQVTDWDKLNHQVRFRIQDEFPFVEDLTGLLCPDGNKMEINVPVESISGKFLEFFYQDQDISMQQTWDFDEMTIHYQNMKLKAFKDIGTARRLLRGTLKAYRKLGFWRIEVSTTSDGGYMWAKLGFLPYPDQMEDIEICFMNQCVTGDHDVDAEMEQKYSDIYQLIDIEDPKSIWRIVRHPHGKDILTNCVWNGYFDLHDPEQIKQLLGKAE